jgi:hypothetical protein
MPSFSGGNRDSELLRLGELWRAAIERVASSASSDQAGWHTDAYINDMFEIVDEIEAQEASTPAGAAVKLRVALYGAEVAAGSQEDLEYTWLLVQQALSALENSGGTASDMGGKDRAVQTKAIEIVRQGKQKYTREVGMISFAARKLEWQQLSNKAVEANKRPPQIPSEKQDRQWMDHRFYGFTRNDLRWLRAEFWPEQRTKRGPRGPRGRRNSTG